MILKDIVAMGRILGGPASILVDKDVRSGRNDDAVVLDDTSWNSDTRHPTFKFLDRVGLGKASKSFERKDIAVSVFAGVREKELARPLGRGSFRSCALLVKDMFQQRDAPDLCCVSTANVISLGIEMEA